MRTSTISGVAIAIFVMGIAAPAFAQSDEVRRAVERAIGASISSTVSESLSRSIVTEGLAFAPQGTLFGNPFYNHTEVDFLGVDAEADSGGAIVGGLYKVHDLILLHGAFSGSGTSVEAGGLDASGSAIQMTFGADGVYLNRDWIKAWATLEGSISHFDTDVSDGTTSWGVGPSTTFSMRSGAILFEPTLGFTFSDSFDGGGDVFTSMLINTALKYRGEYWRPQLNLAYSKVLDPDTQDDGFIAVGPEILYAVTPAILVGGAYSYGTSIGADADVDAHTITGEFRWSF